MAINHGLPDPVRPPSLPEVGGNHVPVPLQERSAMGGEANAFGGSAPNGSANVNRMVGALVRHKWLLLAAGITGLGGGVLASRWYRPTYTAQGSLFINTSDRREGDHGPIQQGELLESFGWVELLKSFMVLDNVVTQERLYITAKSGATNADFENFALAAKFLPGEYRYTVAKDGGSFALTTIAGGEIHRGAIGDTVGVPVGLSWVPPRHLRAAGTVVDFLVSNPRDVSRELQTDLVPAMVTDGNFLRVTYRGQDPQRLAATVNSTMNRFVEVAKQLKREKLDELTKILDQQRDWAEQALKRSELELERFRVETITLPSQQGAPIASGVQETRDPVIDNFFRLQMQREDLRRDRAVLQDIVAKSRTGELTVDALVAVPAVANNAAVSRLLTELNEKRAELRALQKRYTNEAAPVRGIVQSIVTLETQTVPAAVRDLQAQIAAQEQDLDARIASAGGELRQIPPRQIEETRLERNVSIATNLHGVLQERYETARLAAVSSIPDVSVIDQAEVPGRPDTDNRPILIAGFSAGMLGLALLGVLLKDRSDRRVRYPEQVTGMGLPILGALPHVKDGLSTKDRDAAIQLEESFRELRLSIVHAHGSAGPLMLSVSSPESGDGKSTVAGSLAAVFAGQGHKVVLVDGDIRRGDLHRSLGLRRTPGLTDYLAGRVRLEEVMQPCDRGFTLIGSGTRMHAGPELLGSPAMSQLIRDLRSHFAVIIMDTPPLGAGVDAYVLGTATGNMVLVLRTGSTDGALAEAKLALLDRLPVRVLGAVLNDVPPSRIYRHYTYLPGYQAEDEPFTTVPVASLPGDQNTTAD